MILILGACFVSTEDSGGLNLLKEVDVSGYVVGLFGGGGVQGVEVCLKDNRSLCTQTDADGYYELSGIEANRNHVLFLEQEGQSSGSIAFVAQEDSLVLNNVSLLGEELILGQLAALDQEWSEDKGIIAFSVSNGVNGDGINIQGVGVDLDQGSVYFSNELGLPVAGLDETTTNGGGVIIQIDAKEHQLSYVGLPELCEVIMGWGTPFEHIIPVFDQRVSFARLECISQ